MSGDRTEVYALRYSARPEARASEAFHRFDLYGEPDVARAVARIDDDLTWLGQ